MSKTQSSKPRLEKDVSPRGVAVWPKISGEPDDYQGKKNYNIQVAFEPDENPEHKAFIEKLDQHYEKAVAEAEEEYSRKPKKDKKTGKPVPLEVMDPPYRVEFTEDTPPKPTGRTLVRFKMTAEGKKANGEPWSQKPVLADAKGNRITKLINVGGGSEVIVAFQYYPFRTDAGAGGLALRLDGVQILKLVEYASKDPKSLGFKEEEGYDFAAESAGTDDADGDATEDDGDDPSFA